MEVKEKEDLIEAKEENLIPINNYENKNRSDVLLIFGFFTFIFILVLLITFCIFTILNTKNKNIIHGIYIKGINVSGLSKEQAYKTLSENIMTLKHLFQHLNYQYILTLMKLSKWLIKSEEVEIYSKII